ncbi:MAG: leucine--tRNA ligase, partial [Patescibacteria group bacterium]
KIKPRDATEKNIANFTRQLKSLGFSFDWKRVVDTTDPQYFKWTQWIFLKFFEKGLAYQAEIPINWCVDCKIGLANEEVVDGKCERCGGRIERRVKKQWMLAITKYAQKLLDGLETVDFLPRIKAQQQNWIGRSEGAEVDFAITNSAEKMRVFTTRPDTLFGATYTVLAPEAELLQKLKPQITNWSEVEKYLAQAAAKSDLERTELAKEKTGVELKGVRAINPVNGEEIPIFVADYVLGGYGTGAIMAVPAHDERDFEFATKFGVAIREVVEQPKGSTEKCFTGDGIAINSGEFDGLPTAEFKKKITGFLEKNKLGKKAVNFKLRDWVFSRQRYWGEPIPIVHCAKCGVVPIPEKDLPLELPDVEKYEPTDTGESPLAAIDSWVNCKCPQCGGAAKRETDTMPNWAGSSWYFLRYIDPQNSQQFAAPEKLKYWLPVDLYNGGMEHTVLHLLYSRFWHQFLFDQKLVPTPEPYAKRISHGMILGPDGEKMSKSRGNVVNPDEIVANFGADTLRLYEMFIGPFDQAAAWSTGGVAGVRKFLEKVWRLFEKIKDKENPDLEKTLHKTIQKVSSDIAQKHFNTAISALMIFVNEATAVGLAQKLAEDFLRILAPFAPHLAEELWEKLGHKNSIHLETWPTFDPALVKDETITLAVSVNGKLRDTISVPAEISKDDAIAVAKSSEKIQKWLEGKAIRKEIFVPGKMVNFVV